MSDILYEQAGGWKSCRPTLSSKWGTRKIDTARFNHKTLIMRKLKYSVKLKYQTRLQISKTRMTTMLTSAGNGKVKERIRKLQHKLCFDERCSK